MVNLKRTREDILSSVGELIHRQGVQSTGLKELFAASQVSSGSFYNYFESKDELAHAIIDFKWSELKAAILIPARNASGDPIANLFWMIDRLEEKHLSDPNCAGCLLGNLIVDLVEHDTSFQEHLVQVFDEWQSTIAQLLQAGQSQLQAHVTPEELAEQLLTMIEGVLLMERLYKQPARLQRGFNMIRALLKASLAQAHRFTA
ncbi:TetR/AcrR family transcriptional regulator [Chroogloeocystis siderophila]|jgi:TetR/AcrR family transcriptional repressor of nem operon|uniref:TetR family transcriptional regulator n=1 Tax=Chroogloeocystis siderophila 5.2 s.c.1 TaxID=247279 RepID=A0A1U7HV16_9CHRO|nr:TetR/AcrR family transcriptional regulator [Chroogloeocystis siderophila]OKH27375.1 TetR family transcriptional regulator [Chroogloeocystis siderophila 5.2 s.c.1]